MTTVYIAPDEQGKALVNRTLRGEPNWTKLGRLSKVVQTPFCRTRLPRRRRGRGTGPPGPVPRSESVAAQRIPAACGRNPLGRNGCTPHRPPAGAERGPT